MPYTARLSKRFYDRFGDEIVNELVDLLNAVDTTYRAELREQNELNFARFESRLTELEGRMDARLVALEARVDVKIAALGSRLSAEVARLEARMEAHQAAIEKRLGEHLRWQFVTWTALLIPILGLWFR